MEPSQEERKYSTLIQKCFRASLFVIFGIVLFILISQEVYYFENRKWSESVTKDEEKPKHLIPRKQYEYERKQNYAYLKIKMENDKSLKKPTNIYEGKKMMIIIITAIILYKAFSLIKKNATTAFLNKKLQKQIDKNSKEKQKKFVIKNQENAKEKAQCAETIISKGNARNIVKENEPKCFDTALSAVPVESRKKTTKNHFGELTEFDVDKSGTEDLNDKKQNKDESDKDNTDNRDINSEEKKEKETESTLSALANSSIINTNQSEDHTTNEVSEQFCKEETETEDQAKVDDRKDGERDSSDGRQKIETISDENSNKENLTTEDIATEKSKAPESEQEMSCSTEDINGQGNAKITDLPSHAVIEQDREERNKNDFTNSKLLDDEENVTHTSNEGTHTNKTMDSPPLSDTDKKSGVKRSDDINGPTKIDEEKETAHISKEGEFLVLNDGKNVSYASNEETHRKETKNSTLSVVTDNKSGIERKDPSIQTSMIEEGKKTAYTLKDEKQKLKSDYTISFSNKDPNRKEINKKVESDESKQVKYSKNQEKPTEDHTKPVDPNPKRFRNKAAKKKPKIELKLDFGKAGERDSSDEREITETTNKGNIDKENSPSEEITLEKTKAAESEPEMPCSTEETHGEDDTKLTDSPSYEQHRVQGNKNDVNIREGLDDKANKEVETEVSKQDNYTRTQEKPAEDHTKSVDPVSKVVSEESCEIEAESKDRVKLDDAKDGNRDSSDEKDKTETTNKGNTDKENSPSAEISVEKTETTESEQEMPRNTEKDQNIRDGRQKKEKIDKDNTDKKNLTNTIALNKGILYFFISFSIFIVFFFIMSSTVFSHSGATDNVSMVVASNIQKEERHKLNNVKFEDSEKFSEIKIGKIAKKEEDWFSSKLKVNLYNLSINFHLTGNFSYTGSFISENICRVDYFTSERSNEYSSHVSNTYQTLEKTLVSAFPSKITRDVSQETMYESLSEMKYMKIEYFLNNGNSHINNSFDNSKILSLKVFGTSADSNRNEKIHYLEIFSKPMKCIGENKKPTLVNKLPENDDLNTKYLIVENEIDNGEPYAFYFKIVMQEILLSIFCASILIAFISYALYKCLSDPKKLSSSITNRKESSVASTQLEIELHLGEYARNNVVSSEIGSKIKDRAKLKTEKEKGGFGKNNRTNKLKNIEREETTNSNSKSGEMRVRNNKHFSQNIERPNRKDESNWRPSDKLSARFTPSLNEEVTGIRRPHLSQPQMRNVILLQQGDLRFQYIPDGNSNFTVEYKAEERVRTQVGDTSLKYKLTVKKEVS